MEPSAPRALGDTARQAGYQVLLHLAAIFEPPAASEGIPIHTVS